MRGSGSSRSVVHALLLALGMPACGAPDGPAPGANVGHGRTPTEAPSPAAETSGVPTSPPRTPAPLGQELEGTVWVLRSLRGESPVRGTLVTLIVREGFVEGKMRCHGYGGEYLAAAGGSLPVPRLAATDAGCGDGANSKEIAYIDTLEQVAGYAIAAKRLRMTDAAREAVLVFAPEPPLKRSSVIEHSE